MRYIGPAKSPSSFRKQADQLEKNETTAIENNLFDDEIGIISDLKIKTHYQYVGGLVIFLKRVEVRGQAEAGEFVGTLETSPGLQVISARNAYGKSLTVKAIG